MKTSSRSWLSFLMTAFVFVAFITCAVAPALAQSPMDVTFQAQPTGKPLERKLLIVLKDGGKPVTDANIEVDINMPSMPMMHRVPKAKATPSGTPGEYSASVTLEMRGEWAARIVVDKPQRTTVVHKFQVD